VSRRSRLQSKESRREATASSVTEAAEFEAVRAFLAWEMAQRN
jgi:hypothetical protein